MASLWSLLYSIPSCNFFHTEFSLPASVHFFSVFYSVNVFDEFHVCEDLAFSFLSRSCGSLIYWEYVSMITLNFLI
mgnify:CR=1 FL=1